MKKIVLGLISILFINPSVFSQKNNLTLQRPKVVIGVVMDQMRWDYLYRFYDKYSQNGFKRLLSQGTSCENTYINYLPSYTAPGHATIYTGTTPAHHGIVSNDWIENNTHQNMYCVQDDGVTTLDSKQLLSNKKVGQKSPKNLQASTISDELKLHYNFKNRAFGISLKDRGAILPAGHTADAAYWFDTETGQFVSSTHYLTQLPEWLNHFNSRNIADSLLRQGWNTLYSLESYTLSTPDNNQYEGIHKHESTPTFPHHYLDAITKDYKVLPYTPYGNTIVRMLAQDLIKNEKIGHGTHTDFLAISFSATDYIGHMYGPNAIEVEDMYYRLDQEVALLLNFLDSEYGAGNYLLFLTADHGGAHNFNFLKDAKIPAGSINEKVVEEELRSALKNLNIPDSVVLDVENYQVYFNHQFITQLGLDIEHLSSAIQNILAQDSAVAFVFNIHNMNTTTIPQNIIQMISYSYHPQRSGDIQIILKPGYYSGYGMTTGTTHGGWHPFDTHIPLIYYGWHIPKGKKIYRKINMTDIAPTICALLKIQEPNANIGHVITEIFED